MSRYRLVSVGRRPTNGKVSRRGTRSAAWHDLLFHGSFVRATHAPTLVYFRTPRRAIHVNRARHCLIQFYSDLVIRLRSLTRCVTCTRFSLSLSLSVVGLLLFMIWQGSMIRNENVIKFFAFESLEFCLLQFPIMGKLEIRECNGTKRNAFL